MEYQEVIRDFAERTRANLRAIKDLQKSGSEVYEKTQLINSMLGLLVFPRQEFIHKIPKIPLSELVRDGWPAPKVMKGFPEVKDLHELIGYLRHAVAHFNILFLVDAGRQLTGVRVWNTPPNSTRKTWEAELSLEDLGDIAERFTDLILKGNGKFTTSVRV